MNSHNKGESSFDLIKQRTDSSTEMVDDKRHNTIDKNEVLNEILILLKNDTPEQIASEIHSNLRKYFNHHRFDFDRSILLSFCDFFVPGSNVWRGEQGVYYAADIFCSILYHELKRNDPSIFLDLFISEELYTRIWPFSMNVPVVIDFFAYALDAEDNFLKKTITFEFLVRNKIYELIMPLLNNQNSTVEVIFHLINSFSYYLDDCYDQIIPFLHQICVLIISTSWDLVVFEGFCTLFKFVRMNPKILFTLFEIPDFLNRLCQAPQIYLQINEQLQNAPNDQQIQLFFQFSHTFLIQTLNFILRALIEIEKLLVPEMGRSCADRREYNDLMTPFKMPLYQMLFQCLKIIQQNVIKMTCKSLYYLVSGWAEVDFFIQNNIPSYLIQLMNSDSTNFAMKVEIIRLLAGLVSSSNENQMEIFIDQLNYLEIVTDLIEELMTEIPHAILDSLENINYLAEISKTAARWNSMIFDNDQLVKTFQNLEENESDTESDEISELPLYYHICNLTSRMYNKI